MTLDAFWYTSIFPRGVAAPSRLTNQMSRATKNRNKANRVLSRLNKPASETERSQWAWRVGGYVGGMPCCSRTCIHKQWGNEVSMTSKRLAGSVNLKGDFILQRGNTKHTERSLEFIALSVLCVTSCLNHENSGCHVLREKANGMLACIYSSS